MPKTMLELYAEVGPQGWPEDPLTDDQKTARIDEINDLIEELQAEIEGYDDRISELQDASFEAEEEIEELKKELKTLRG